MKRWSRIASKKSNKRYLLPRFVLQRALQCRGVTLSRSLTSAEVQKIVACALLQTTEKVLSQYSAEELFDYLLKQCVAVAVRNALVTEKGRLILEPGQFKVAVNFVSMHLAQGPRNAKMHYAEYPNMVEAYRKQRAASLRDSLARFFLLNNVVSNIRLNLCENSIVAEWLMLAKTEP